ncbi:MAG TPA: hypothetical protein VGG20_10180, partial [Thermoanaerobaculia bacterium]
RFSRFKACCPCCIPAGPAQPLADLNQPANSKPILKPIGLFTQGTYNANSSDPSQDSSATFTGTDTNGSPMTIRIIGNATPSAVSKVIVTQAIVSGGK